MIPYQKNAPPPRFETASKTLEALDQLNLKDEYNALLKKVEKELSEDKNKDFYLGDAISDKEEKISSYIKHCTRAYCSSKYLKDQKLEDVENCKIKINPRLIDDLFLRIK